MKKYGLVLGGTLVALLIAGVFVTSGVFAQETSTQAGDDPSLPLNCFERGPWHGRRLGAAGLEAAAGALGMDTDDLSAKFKEGMTLTEIAEEAGVDIQTVRDAIDAARIEAMRAKIDQALTDGTITQEHADWLLAGLDQGFLTGHGFGLGFGKHGPPPVEAQAELPPTE